MFKKDWAYHKRLCGAALPMTLEEILECYRALLKELNMGVLLDFRAELQLTDVASELEFVTLALNMAMPFTGVATHLSMTEEQRQLFRERLAAKGGGTAPVLLAMLALPPTLDGCRTYERQT